MCDGNGWGVGGEEGGVGREVDEGNVGDEGGVGEGKRRDVGRGWSEV